MYDCLILLYRPQGWVSFWVRVWMPQTPSGPRIGSKQQRCLGKSPKSQRYRFPRLQICSSEHCQQWHIDFMYAPCFLSWCNFLSKHWQESTGPIIELACCQTALTTSTKSPNISTFQHTFQPNTQFLCRLYAQNYVFPCFPCSWFFTVHRVTLKQIGSLGLQQYPDMQLHLNGKVLKFM